MRLRLGLHRDPLRRNRTLTSFLLDTLLLKGPFYQAYNGLSRPSYLDLLNKPLAFLSDDRDCLLDLDSFSIYMVPH